MINAKQLTELVIVPTLEYLGMNSDAAVNLMLGTLAQESAMGTYIKQIRGPALGIYQMEPDTHQDIYESYLSYRPDLRFKLGLYTRGDHQPPEQMITDLNYATAMARLQYFRRPEALPDAEDLVGLALYWKEYYNTIAGAGTIDEFIDNYKRYVL